MAPWIMRARIIGFWALVGTSMALAGCGPSEGADEATSPEGAGVVEAAPSRTVEVQRATVPRLHEVSATVRSVDHIQVAAETSGRVLRMVVDVGDRVRRGQLMAVLDAAVLSSSRDAARAERDLAVAELDRAERLLATQAGSQRDVDRARSRVGQARANFRIARTAVGRTQVRAPVDGVVEARRVGPGDLAVPGAALFALYDPERLALQAFVPVGDRDHVEVGGKVSFTIRGVRSEGEIAEVTPSSDPRSRTMRIRVPLSEELMQSGVTPGQFGTLAYVVGEREEIAIPEEALIQVGQLDMVRVQLESGWSRRAVRRGASADGQVEILAGLAGGETLGLR